MRLIGFFKDDELVHRRRVAGEMSFAALLDNLSKISDSEWSIEPIDEDQWPDDSKLSDAEMRVISP